MGIVSLAMDEGVVLVGIEYCLIIGAGYARVTGGSVRQSGKCSGGFIKRQKAVTDPSLDLGVAGNLISCGLLQNGKPSAQRRGSRLGPAITGSGLPTMTERKRIAHPPA